MSDGDDSIFSYDAANEQIVIGAAITDGEARRVLVHRLAADEFLIPKHAVIWRALREMADRSLTYTREVVDRLVLDAGGDAKALEYLREIEADARTPANLDWHVETMGWDAQRARALKGPIPELLRAIREPKAGHAEVLGLARSVSRALEGAGRRHIHRPAELHRHYRAEVAARRASRNVYPLGAEPFDHHLTEGFMPGRMTVTAGLPGAGKSTVWIAFAILLARTTKRRILYCGWEMDAESLLDVGAAHMTGIPLKSIVQGTLTDEETERVDKAARWIVSRIKFMGNPFFERGGGGKKPSNDRNIDLLEGYLADAAAEVAIFDLWERMLPWRDPDDVAGSLFRMQALFKEYNIHGVIVHQLRLKDVETRADKRPTREAIKGSGAFVEVPDLILGIHREAQFKAVEDTSIETICLKQRKGKANWACRWKWDGATCQVSNPEEVPFDPGLENAVEAGDIGRAVRDTKDIKTGRKRKSEQQTIGRRE